MENKYIYLPICDEETFQQVFKDSALKNFSLAGIEKTVYKCLNVGCDKLAIKPWKLCGTYYTEEFGHKWLVVDAAIYDTHRQVEMIEFDGKILSNNRDVKEVLNKALTKMQKMQKDQSRSR